MTKSNEEAALSAALSVPSAEVVGEPEGWKLVPIEPTPEMESKGADAFFSPQPQSIEDENARAASVYRRMLSAAPSAPDGYVRGHLHLIRCFADDMTERNWEDKRLYIKQQVDFIVSALGGSHE